MDETVDIYLVNLDISILLRITLAEVNFFENFILIKKNIRSNASITRITSYFRWY